MFIHQEIKTFKLERRKLDGGITMSIWKDRTFNKARSGRVHTQVYLVQLTVTRGVIVALDPWCQTTCSYDRTLYATKTILFPIWLNPCIILTL